MNRFHTIALAAAVLAATPAWAQDDDARYRPLTVTPAAGVLVSVEVAGPQDARRFQEVMVLREPEPTGPDSFFASFAANCPAGTLTLEKLTGYRDGKVTMEIAVGPSDVEKPSPGSVSDDMLKYACTGKTSAGDATVVTGLTAAFAHGRKLLH